jgi:hypothetical protein
MPSGPAGNDVPSNLMTCFMGWTDITVIAGERSRRALMVDHVYG